MQTYSKIHGMQTRLFSYEQRPRLPDLICLSHLRWNSVYQRPQHLMARFARERRVFFVEEPVFEASYHQPSDSPQELGRLLLMPQTERLLVVTPSLPRGLSEDEVVTAQQHLLNRLLAGYRIEDFLLWYYTPMALSYTRQLEPRRVIYDCMDELSSWPGAQPQLRSYELELFARADVVMAGGYSLYEAKRPLHSNVHLFPSSVDQAHFAKARTVRSQPRDQACIPCPRIGYFGGIDDRMNLALVDAVARARPDWQLVLLGPIVKRDLTTLPRHDNVHYLGMKSYDELPSYLAGWDVAMLPYSHNDATRYISPTRVPEYLAAGKPVVCTSIHDVVYPYGQQGLVYIADSAEDFVTAIESALTKDHSLLLPIIDAMLARNSWDRTFLRMKQIIDGDLAVERRYCEGSIFAQSF